MSRFLQLSIPAVFAGLFLCGCGGLTEHYPDNLKYTLRTDLMMAVGPQMKGQPTILPSPGHLDEAIEAAVKKEEAKAYHPANLKSSERTELARTLNDIFGTPRYPKVAARGADALGLDDSDKLELGSRLYRMHCMHCHGVTGNGRGPTGPWVHPHPRDYRQGLFKFISTPESVGPQKPRRADLARVLRQGVDGTSMPAFGILPPDQIESLVLYVTHLSIRGETEYAVMSTILLRGDTRPDPREDEVAKLVAKQAEFITNTWRKSDAAEPIQPPAYPSEFEGDSKEAEKALHQSIINGHKLFLSKDAACATCHYDYGRQSAYRYDSWGTLVQPRNLTAGNYRGGRRPLDLFWRISGGINPSGMPALKLSKPEEYWDIVNFVRALPYPSMLPDEVRKKVYGHSETVLKPGEKPAPHK